MRSTTVVLVCAAFFICSTGCSKHEAKPYRIGLVNVVSGKVLVTGSGGKVFPAAVGTPLDEGMRIRTEGKNSFCEIYIRDTAVKLFGDTAVNVSRLRYDKAGGERTAMSLDDGRLFIRVVRKLSKEDRFAIRTPMCVAGVRGTEFFVTKSDVSCLDGKMEVQSIKAKGSLPVTIADGEAAKASAGSVKKSSIDKETQKKLSSDAAVKPVEKKNQELFDRLDAGDKSALSELRGKLRTMSGSDAPKEKKEDKPDVDLFFFKS